MQTVVPIRHDLPECLTANNWQEVGVSIISYELTSLLVKPGFDCLMQFSSLADFLAWSGRLVLNATELLENKAGNYRIRSSLDGSQVEYSFDQLLLIIAKMKADIVLFPIGWGHKLDSMLDKIPPTTQAFFSVHDKLSNPSHGVYFKINDVDDLTQLINEHASQSRYVLVNTTLGRVENSSLESLRPATCSRDLEIDLSGSRGQAAGRRDLNSQQPLDCLERLSNLGVDYSEMACPIQSALEGKVYSSEGVISIASDASATNFNVIDTDCACPTCQQLLTQAYLHHLFLHVPLLCQRFLIQHNVYTLFTR